MYTASRRIIRGVIGIGGLAALCAIAGTGMWLGYFESNPWFQAAMQGGLIGLIGATVFISIAWVTDILADERRSRQILALCHDQIRTPDPAANLGLAGTILSRLPEHDARVPHPRMTA